MKICDGSPLWMSAPNNSGPPKPPTTVPGAEKEADEDQRRLAALDERAEQQRAAEAADDRAGRVEERDRHRARLHREDLADRQVRGARAGRGEEEDDAPGDRLG